MDGSCPWMLGVSAASGVVYAADLARRLVIAGVPFEWIFSDQLAPVIEIETGVKPQSVEHMAEILLDEPIVGAIRLGRLYAKAADEIPVHRHISDLPASGSRPTSGLVICPCSLATIGRVAAGICDTLLARAAEVHLKEHRPCVVVPRETPLSVIALRNMTTLAEAGAVILPAMPGFYHGPKKLEDLVAFISGKIMNAIGIRQDALPAYRGYPESEIRRGRF